LQRAIAARARKATRALLENYDAATLLLENSGGEENAREALAAQIKAALPANATADRTRMLLIALPTSAAGEKLRGRASHLSTDSGATIVTSDGDIVLCQESAGIPPQEILPAGTDSGAALAPLAARINTRIDVAWSGLGCSAL